MLVIGLDGVVGDGSVGEVWGVGVAAGCGAFEVAIDHCLNYSGAGKR